MDPWDKPEVQALGEERLKLLRQAAEQAKGKEGLERLDVFLEYGEKLAAGDSLPAAEQKALLAAVAASLPKEEQNRLTQIVMMLGL